MNKMQDTQALPCIGLIVPPAAGDVPRDAGLLYGDRIRFVARGLGIGGVSPSGFAPVMARITQLACELRDEGAQTISLMGTSISFYQGPQLTERLRQQLEAVTGLSCTTMSHAIISSLKALGARRVAVATSYIDELNQCLVRYLEHHGFVVTHIRGLSITGVQAMGEVPPETLIELASSVYAHDPGADAILISCGGLQTHEVIAPLESRLGVPVIASSPSGFWDVVRQSGIDPRSAGYGRLFELQ